MPDEFEPTKQRQITIGQSFLTRLIPEWASPRWTEANMWRYLVRQQPLCIIARDTLISYLLGTNWEISARVSEDKSKYDKEIEHYTELMNNLDGLDFHAHLDMLCQDILDTPFGGASEIGRENDLPDGKTLWAQHIDSATLYPTNIPDYPVAQRVPGVPDAKPVLFPKHAISRAYYTPRPEINKRGWGMAPPEKIYLAVELLYRGDRYYANLLLDTPEAGVLDLLDMSKDSATEWLESFKLLFGGMDAFKVPVLYEHTTAAKWIPFGRPPTDLIYDQVTFKFAQIVCAGYGLKIGDIGISKDEGRTLAGVIRTERQTRRTGFAVLSSRTKAYFERMLPKYLKFTWLDSDDEAMIARGRARLANAQALVEMKNGGILSQVEARRQMSTDGLLSIQIDPDDVSDLQQPISLTSGGPFPGRPSDAGKRQVPPSAGGRGNAKPIQKYLSEAIEATTRLGNDPQLRRLAKAEMRALFPDFAGIVSDMNQDDVEAWLEGMLLIVFEDQLAGEIPDVVRSAVSEKRDTITSLMNSDPWWSVSKHIDPDVLFAETISVYENGISDAALFISKSLYEEGRLPAFGPIEAKLTEAPIIEVLRQGSQNAPITLDQQTADRMKKIIMAAVYESFATPTVIASIHGGLGEDGLLEDDGYINLLTGMTQRGLGELANAHIEGWAQEYDDLVWGAAVARSFVKAGIPEEQLDQIGINERTREIAVSPHKFVGMLNGREVQIWKGE